MNVWARLLVDVEAAIEAGTSLSPSPQPFTINNIPETLTGRVFSVDIQSANTGKERERTHIRASHRITVEMLNTLARNPKIAQHFGNLLCGMLCFDVITQPAQ